MQFVSMINHLILRKLIISVALITGTLFITSTSVFAEDEGPNPYTYSDDSYISINGTVKSVSPDSFLLNFGEGVIKVEMDDGDRDADAYKLVEGDEVTVYGLIDDDLFESRTIEAGSVYVKNINTYFYASAIDEEDYEFVTIATPVTWSTMSVQGKVASININDEEFTIGTGTRSFQVDVTELPDNPLDDEGYQKIKIGDVVNVTGTLEYGFLEGEELVADSITTIHDWDG